MIDLRNWRESRSRRYKWVALFILSSCYILIITPAMMSLSRMQREKVTLQAELKPVKPHKEAINPVTSERVMLINKLVWSQRNYVLTLMHKLDRIPPGVVLVSLECHRLSCEFDAVSDQLLSLMQAVTNSELKDLKQGGCPLCYRAKINVMLS